MTFLIFVSEICQLNLKNEDGEQKVKFPPIFYSDNGDLIPPIPAVEEETNNNHFYSNNKVIVLENKKALTVACPGNK